MAVPVKVTGVGAYAPERVLTNRDLERMVETSDEWITSRTGIKERHIVAPGEATSDMAYEAAKEALAMARTAASDLDLIVVGTVTPDMPFPSAACFLQERLGAKSAAALDLSAGCTGFLYAFHVGVGLVKAGVHQKVLVVGADTTSTILDWTDRGTCVLLGDGAGAVVVEPAPDGEPGVLSTHVGADGALWELLHMPGGGSRHRTSEETVRQGLHNFKMRGNSTFKQAVEIMEGACEDALRKAGIGLEEVDLVIPHQANLRIITALADRMKIPMEKVAVTVQRYGNTSSATCPMALADWVREGRVRPGDTILMVSFGAGLTWASAVFRWTPATA